MLSFEETNVLGQILDTTWGRTSTPYAPTISLKHKWDKDKLTIIYTTVTSFFDHKDLHQNTLKFDEESIVMIDKYISLIKKEFKSKAKRSLKLKLLSSTRDFELITVQPHVSSKKTSYYRRYATFQVE